MTCYPEPYVPGSQGGTLNGDHCRLWEGDMGLPGYVVSGYIRLYTAYIR